MLPLRRAVPSGALDHMSLGHYVNDSDVSALFPSLYSGDHVTEHVPWGSFDQDRLCAVAGDRAGVSSHRLPNTHAVKGCSATRTDRLVYG